MSEGENKKEESQITNDDLRKMEEDVQRASKAEARQIAEDVEKKVRKELAQEQAMRELQAEREKQAKELEALKNSQAETVKQLKDEFEQKLKNIEDARKSTVNTDNPFREQADEATRNELIRRLKNDPKAMNELEEESRKKFLEKYTNLPGDFGTNL